MEVIFWIGIIAIAWWLISGKIKRDRIREALNNIRVQGLKNPEYFSIDFNNNEASQFNSLKEDEAKKFISAAIFTALRNNGYAVEYIQGNIRLSILFSEVVNDIYEAKYY